MSTSAPSERYKLEWVLGEPEDIGVLSDATIEELIGAATNARQRAHASQSNFRVGAALLTPEGKIFTGGNVEATNGDSICAERSAVVKAISEGYTAFSVVCAIGDTEAPITPCGQCRQLLSDLAPQSLVLMATTRSNRVEATRLDRLFPRGNFKTAH
jgi:cytidine deaminase